MFGRGLNSLRIRFSLLNGMLTGTMFAVLCWYLIFQRGEQSITIWHFVLPATLCVLSVAVTYRMTGGLTRPIEQLKASTEAIAGGDFNVEVNVECQCEVGGLADSFRKMVRRMNANISRIHSLAFEDGITGLPNRAVLENLLSEMKNADGAILFIDLDRFKQVNDTLGHDSGDLLLAKAANRMLNEVLDPDNAGEFRRADISTGFSNRNMLFRFAGDEFIAVLPGVRDEAALAAIADNIIAVLQRPFALKDNSVRISASIGIAIMNEFGDDPLDLIKFADLAMYAAKEAGRSQHAFFTKELRQTALDIRDLEQDLVVAIDSDQLVVHFQPKVDSRSRKILGLEALVRWQHPERGLLYPGSFMKIAESCGLVERIGMEVVKQVALQSEVWKKQGLRYRVSVNICPSQFLNENFAINCLDYFRLLDLDPAMMELELTENIAMADPKNAALQLTVLREAGVRIAIDDYGTGFSNLSQLYHLPFDVLKLDRTLIKSIGVDKKGEFIIASTIAMAHALHHTVVAEGVETKEQHEFMLDACCDEIQGYYFAKPMSATDLESWEINRGSALAKSA